MTLNSIVSIFTFFLTILLSSFVLFEDPKNKINKLFSLLSFSIALWIANNTLADMVKDYNLALFLSRTAIIWVALLPIFFNYLISALYFKLDYIYIRKYKLVSLLLIVMLSIIILFSQTSINIDSVVLEESGVNYNPGILYYLLFFELIVGFSFGFYGLFKVFNESKSSKKSQAGFIIAGSLVTVILGVVTNIIFPLLGFSYINVIGPPSVLFFVGLTAIAILKHQLFNVKVIATELLVFSLWIIILIRTIISDTTTDLIINSVLFLVLVIIGIFLIRSVIKEVDQREKIEKLALDLQKANDRLKEVDKQKSEFVSFATHQLRAPLTAMKGYASLILEKEMEPVSEKAREAVGRIFESANTLTAIVDDYLNVTRIELGSIRYTFDTINLKDLVENVIAELKPNIDKSININFSVNIEKSSDYLITADKDKLKQVIANLVDNSVKYTPKGKVVVSLSYDTLSHVYVFKVSDTGIGISSQILPKLFQKWSRSDNANKTNIKGTGLGLYVAKEIINAHHGTIRAESPGEGKGSVFTVELKPLNQA